MLKGLITYPVSENLSSVLGLFCIRRIRNHRSTWRTVIPSCWLKLVRESARGILPMRVIHILRSRFSEFFFIPPPSLPLLPSKRQMCDLARLNSYIFAAQVQIQIQIPIPNIYLECGCVGLVFCRNKGQTNTK